MGFLVDAAGSIDAGNAAKKTGRINRDLSFAQANDALLRGSQEESRYRREIAQIIGAQKATFGQRNVTASGTALDLLADTAMIGEEDVMTIRNNAAREAWGYRKQGEEAYRQGKAAKKQAYLKAGATLLTGAQQSMGKW